MMRPKTFIAIGFALLSACSSAPVDLFISNDHPAHPKAPQAPYVSRPDTLGTEAPSFLAPRTDPVAAGRPALTVNAARHLTRALKAYIGIGDLLAADTFEGTRDRAAEVDSAMLALACFILPDDPHFWHRHDTEVQTIRQQAKAIGEAKELKAARVAYGILSDAMERLTNEVDVPDAFDNPVYSYTCGMFEAAPRNGVWLQLGDNARNPYYGSVMLGCYRTEYELPTVKTADQQEAGPPDDRSKHGHQYSKHDHQQGGKR